ncbi:MAG: molybdenum cofactor guanylyltransferase [Oscillospiraceae bacterium]|nr:molybdenum cofactor guanylyltransferase [Oscillospiraceae bacterium]
MSTAVILAGGKSSRMGQDKTQLIYHGKTLLAGAVERFSASFDNVYLSIGAPEKYPDIKAERVIDLYPGCGPMAGLHAALLKTPDEGVFLAAADLPFSSPAAALKIIEICGDNASAVIVRENGKFEPAFGYYTKPLLPFIEECLANGKYRMMQLFDVLPCRQVSPAELGELWREDMLDNLNYPEDYERLIGN